MLNIETRPDDNHEDDDDNDDDNDRLRVAAESPGGLSDYSETCFVTTEPIVPEAPPPPTLREKPKSNSLHLTWRPPAYDGGAAITE